MILKMVSSYIFYFFFTKQGQDPYEVKLLPTSATALPLYPPLHDGDEADRVGQIQEEIAREK